MTAPLLNPGRGLPRRKWLLAAAAGTAGWCLPHAQVQALSAAVPAPPADVCHTPSTEAMADTGARPVSVVLPSVALMPMRGPAAPLTQRIRTADAVMLNFIFTSCTSVCPPMSQIFASAQERMGARAAELQLVSVSIDPEHDTPKRLLAYSERFGAGPSWSFHTGSQAAVDTVLRAFHIYRPDKMGHTPATFIKPRGQNGWLQVDGFARADRLLALALGSVPK